MVFIPIVHCSILVHNPIQITMVVLVSSNSALSAYAARKGCFNVRKKASLVDIMQLHAAVDTTMSYCFFNGNLLLSVGTAH